MGQILLLADEWSAFFLFLLKLSLSCTTENYNEALYFNVHYPLKEFLFP